MKIPKLTFLIEKVTLCLFGGLVVARLPENYPFQPAYILYFAMPIYFLIFKNKLIYTRQIAIFIIFCAYFFFLNLFYVYNEGSFDAKIVNALYWPLCIVLLVSIANARIEQLKFLITCITGWLMLSVALAVYEFITSFPTRASGISGSPNNLALSLVHIEVIRRVLKLDPPNVVLKVLGAVNLSRAYIVYIILMGLRISLKNILLIAALLFISINAINLIGSEEVFSFLEGRFDFAENSSDEGGRGVRRVFLHPEYLFFGAGDLRAEFTGDDFSGQIHNNFLALFFCFGIPGLLFSVYFFKLLINNVGIYIAAVYFFYSTTLFFYNNIFFVILVASLLHVSQRRGV